MSAALEVRDLSVSFAAAGAERRVVQDLSFRVAAGEVLGLAGESGSGKSQLLLALMGLSPRGARVSGGAALAGAPLLGLPEAQLRRLRGNRIAMVFQDPLTALNPYLRIGRQLTEVLEVHRGCTAREAKNRAIAMLEAVRIDRPAERFVQYPHQLSGGQRQRVVLAMALLCEPAVLLADEPTTALDVTVQAQILDLVAELTRSSGTAVVFVTHDLGVLAQIADQVIVMQQGRAVEAAPVGQLFAAPRHACTQRLLAASRELGVPQPVAAP